ncbi:hypothetical protein [Puia dinghuensis]|nr:hypothetical protein [Puia dinghuensis]
MRRSFWARKVAGFIVLAILGIFLFGSIVMLLWNALMPELFHLPVITFWQALGLLVLTKILFSGFRGGGPRMRMRNKMREKWMNMTPEEREKFKQEWGGRCGRASAGGHQNEAADADRRADDNN